MHFLQLTVDDYGMDKEIASVTFALFATFSDKGSFLVVH